MSDYSYAQPCSVEMRRASSDYHGSVASRTIEFTTFCRSRKTVEATTYQVGDKNTGRGLSNRTAGPGAVKDQVSLASAMSETFPSALGPLALVTTRSIFSACRRMRLHEIEMSSSVVADSEYFEEADEEK